MYGASDRTCPPSSVERMHLHCPSLRIVKLADVGHWIMLERAETVVNNVADFVREICTEATATKL